MKRNILFVQQYLAQCKEIGPIFPIGLSYLVATAQNCGWNVKVVDLNIYENPYGILLDTIDSFKPDITALSIRNIDNESIDSFNYYYQELKNTTSIIKKGCNHLIVGGAGFSIFAEKIFKQNEDIEFGIFLEGENTLAELLECYEKGESVKSIRGLYYREKGNIFFSGKREPVDFSKSPFPNLDAFELDHYKKPMCFGIQSKRGCTLQCSYCTYPFLNGRFTRLRSPVLVVDEIERLSRDYAINEFTFCDDIFNVPKEHSLTIIKEIIRRNLKVRWSAWFDVANTDLEFMKMAMKAGCCHFCFSIDALDNLSLKLLRKNFSIIQVKNLLKICCQPEFANVSFWFSLFAMPPGQNLFGMIKTLIFIFRMHVAKKNSKCFVSWIRLLPNTELLQNCLLKERELLPQSVIDESQKKNLFLTRGKYPNMVVVIYRKLLCVVFKLRKIWRFV